MENIKNIEELNRKVRGRLYRAAVKCGKTYGGNTFREAARWTDSIINKDCDFDLMRGDYELGGSDCKDGRPHVVRWDDLLDKME